MNGEKFKGPLFIFGMPRSGTKLLRDLLNRHPQINIPVVESHFIPFMISKFGEKPNFQEVQFLDLFLSEFYKTPYFMNCPEQHKMIKTELETRLPQLTRWSEVFEHIFKLFTFDDQIDSKLWGDKTPGYARHIDLLYQLYPTARFIHIIRDPRDQSLSARKAWGKSVILNAAVWRNTIQKARNDADAVGASYHEVFYESLLEDPEAVLSDLCLFLELTFDPDMLNLEVSTEFYGDAKGQLSIVKNNTQKYRSQLTVDQINRIEEIVFPLENVPYQAEIAQRHKPIRKFEKHIYKARNGFNAFKFHAREKGFLDGVIYFTRHYRKSSWR